MESNNGGGCPQGKKKDDEDSLQGKFDHGNFHYEHAVGELLSSNLQEDRNRMMRDVHENPQLRRSMECHYEHQDRILPEGAVTANTDNEALRKLFKITIPYGIKYEKTWLINSIQSYCSVPFTPINLRYVRNQVEFFVQDASTASTLEDINYKIYDEENQKISILVEPSTETHSVQTNLKPEQMEVLMLTMNKRYDVSQKALDLQSLSFDRDLVGHETDMILDERKCMTAALQIIEKNFSELLSLNLCNNKLYQLDGLSDIIGKVPKVKILNLSANKLRTAWELEKVKELDLEELWLEGNPLCRTFPSHAAYVRAIRNCFPKLLRLDGKELPPIAIDMEVPEIIKPCKESYKGSETLKSLILQFLLRYYVIYDSGDRRGLFGAYHEKACFSLTIPFNCGDPFSLWEYFKYSRNMKKLKDPYLRRQLLKHTKHDIVNSLSVLPRTQHDFSSCVVDLCFQTEMMLCFSVSGVFKELEGKSPGIVRAFTRIFILASVSSSSICIVNDKLIVRNASPKETQSAFSTPLPSCFSSSVPTLSQEKMEMVKAFSTQSGMNLEWSQKCLEDNEWNYATAAQIFTMLQRQGRIPEEAFKQIP
nr:nuclear RNA export factor 2 isoform X1 [Oryctolagus cuniculus]